MAVATRYQSRGGSHTLEDLVQIGVLGLIRAIELFDPKLGYKFSTYATTWIHQQIGRACDKDTDLIGAPAAARIDSRKVSRARAIAEAHGVDPSPRACGRGDGPAAGAR